MKKLFLIWVLLLAFATSVHALEVPELKGYVNDYAGMLTPEENAKITRELELYERSTSTQIYILTIPSLEGEVLEQFSMKVAEIWKAGQKGKDNGIIILLSKADRKIRIENGRGTEGAVTDLISGRIIREEMTPRLKEGKTEAALMAAISKIKLALKNEYKAEATDKPSSSGGSKNEAKVLKAKVTVYLFVVIFVAGFFGMMHMILGGIVGAVISALFAIFMWHFGIVGIVIMGIIGFILGLFAGPILESGGSGGGGGFGGSIGDFFSGGGGGFGGGGASGGW